MTDTPDCAPRGAGATEQERLPRELLEVWEAAAPSPQFAERVMRARRETEDAAGSVAGRKTGRRRARIGRFGWAAIAVAAAGAWLLAEMHARRSHPHRSGHATAAAHRRSIDLGGRGVAVMERGAEISYSVGDGAATVSQPRGDVFYRVEPGGPFTVVTPAGRVLVTGTCFRVEVTMKPSKQSLVGAAVGAAVASAVLVTVYEGKVVLADDHGKAEISAGESARATAAKAPELGSGSAHRPGAAGIAARIARASHRELVAIANRQREEIDHLNARVAQLERKLAEAPNGPGRGLRGGPGGEGPFDDWFDASQDQLRKWAKQCFVPYDFPPVMGTNAPQVSAAQAAKLGLSDSERQALDRIYKKIHADFAAEMRGLYVAETGDTRGADELSPQAMATEIRDKALPGQAAVIRQEIARERAGLEAPPTDLSKLSPLERYMRLMASLGDRTEKALAQVVGAERAHEIRRQGFGGDMITGGCPRGQQSRRALQAK